MGGGVEVGVKMIQRGYDKSPHFADLKHAYPLDVGTRIPHRFFLTGPHPRPLFSEWADALLADFSQGILSNRACAFKSDRLHPPESREERPRFPDPHRHVPTVGDIRCT